MDRNHFPPPFVFNDRCCIIASMQAAAQIDSLWNDWVSALKEVQRWAASEQNRVWNKLGGKEIYATCNLTFKATLGSHEPQLEFLFRRVTLIFFCFLYRPEKRLLASTRWFFFFFCTILWLLPWLQKVCMNLHKLMSIHHNDYSRVCSWDGLTRDELNKAALPTYFKIVHFLVGPTHVLLRTSTKRAPHKPRCTSVLKRWIVCF